MRRSIFRVVSSLLLVKLRVVLLWLGLLRLDRRYWRGNSLRSDHLGTSSKVMESFVVLAPDERPPSNGTKHQYSHYYAPNSRLAD